MPKTTNDKHKASYIPYRCDLDTYNTICELARTNHLTQAQVLRSLVRDGLIKQGHTQDEDTMLSTIRDAVQEVVKPHVERLASISAKATQIASADFFFMVYLAHLFTPSGQSDEVDQMATRARQLGIEYLKSRNNDIDEFIQQAVQKMTDDDL